MSRLSLATLASLPASVARPALRPAAVTVGIVHLGLGAFHRAHQAVFTDDVLARDPRWGILGVSMKTPRATGPLAAAGRAVHGARQRQRRDVGSRDRRAARDCVRRRGRGRARRAHRRSARDRRHAHRHREGLLPRSGERPRSTSRIRTSCTTSRIRTRRCRAVGLLVAALDARRDARRGRAQRRLLRQPAAQRARARRARARARAAPRTRALVDWIGDARRRFPARWSIASCRRRPTRTSPRSSGGSASTTRRRSSPSRTTSG